MWGLFVSLGIWEISIGGAELSLELFSQGGSGFDSSDVFFLDILQIEIVDNESGWDDVVLVDNLNERFNSSSFDELFLIN